MPSKLIQNTQEVLNASPTRRAPRSKKAVKSVPEITLLPPASSKQSRLIELLQRPSGATLAELMNATNWQAHSIRGAISGVLRKRLQYLIKVEPSQDGIRHYRIVGGGLA